MTKSSVVVFSLETLFAKPLGKMLTAAPTLNKNEALTTGITNTCHFRSEDTGFLIRFLVTDNFPFERNLPPVTADLYTIKPVGELSAIA
jgi:hypothetical protein